MTDPDGAGRQGLAAGGWVGCFDPAWHRPLLVVTPPLCEPEGEARAGG
jgi:hypothetical protein